MAKVLKHGGTTTTASGTDQTFALSAETITNGVVLVDSGNDDFLSREKVNMTSRSPRLQSDGTYTAAKMSASLVIPITLADGTTSFCTARVEITYHPEATSAIVAELREKGAQMCISSQFDSLWKFGSLE